MSANTRRKRETPAYTRAEELGNTWSHALGAALGVVGTALLLVRALRYGDGLTIFASAVYGASLILLYSISALYHGAKNPDIKRVLRVLDHCSIFLLIAGTYTPFSLILLRDQGGPPLLAVLWGIAIVGVVLNAISVDRFHTLSQIGYLGMGWAAVVLIRPLVATIARPGLYLLVGGGLFYTVGIIFYLVRKVRYFHTIWHFFVLGGSICHFFSVYLYIMPTA